MELESKLQQQTVVVESQSQSLEGMKREVMKAQDGMEGMVKERDQARTKVRDSGGDGGSRC